MYIPTCVQFKIKNFTSIDFDSLTATINGVLCVNFLIFTSDTTLEHFLINRLFWNNQEQAILKSTSSSPREPQEEN
jgi:hypothetical protein